MDRVEDSQSKPRRATFALVLTGILTAVAPLVRLLTWQAAGEFHTVLEVIATQLALTTGGIALVRYYAKRSSMFLLVGAGFLGAGVLDAYHALITSPFIALRSPSALSALTHWSGAVSRVFFSALILASLFAWKKRPLAGRTEERLVFTVVGGWTVVSFLFFLLVPLRPAYYPALFVHRPAELVPAFLFGLAALGYYRKGAWRSDNLEHSVLLSLIAAALSHLVYLTVYNKAGDSMYVAGHVLKVFGYGFVLNGLLSSMFSAFRSEARHAMHLREVNHSLAMEVGERHRAERELRKSHDELERQRDAAEQANRAKSVFLATMSHELRTPLNAVIGYSQMLREDYIGPEQEQVRSDLEKIELSGHLLLGIINDILDLSKIEAGRETMQAQAFDVAEVLRDVSDALQPLARQQGNRLEIHCPGDMRAAYADLSKFRQSVLNLVNNALKFTEKGRVSVAVNRHSNGDGSWTEVHVTDTGIGISREHLSKLFQPFSQVDGSVTRKFNGTGLGLAITKKFCQMMGGDITVESQPGKGSRFSMRVPDATGADAPPAMR